MTLGGEADALILKSELIKHIATYWLHMGTKFVLSTSAAMKHSTAVPIFHILITTSCKH